LEDLGFVVRKTGTITVTPKTTEFAKDPERAPEIFAKAAMQLAGFSSFVEMLRQHQEPNWSLSQLGRNLAERLGHSWKEGTGETIAKIQLDWARHTRLAPSQFSEVRRGRRMSKCVSGQQTLFDNSSD